MSGSDSERARGDPPSPAGVELAIQICPLISPCMRMSSRARLLTRSQTLYEFPNVIPTAKLHAKIAIVIRTATVTRGLTNTAKCHQNCQILVCS